MLVMLSALLLAAAGGTPAPQAPHYDIVLALDVDAGKWSADVSATGIACQGYVARLYLNRGITIRKATVDGRVITPVIDPPGAAPFWISADHAVDVPCPQNLLTLSYEGPGLLHPDGRNQVSPELVELSLYGGWYPLTSLEDQFSWTLTTRLPVAWQYSTPAQVREKVKDNIRFLSLKSPLPSDVVLVASPRFSAISIRSSAVTARVLVSKKVAAEERSRALALGRDGADMATWLQGAIGPARPGVRLQPEIVFTLRGGSLSYARLPLIILREQTLREVSDRLPSLNVRHEIAHFWSQARGSPNDWLNEGLAEYLALVRTGDIEGAAARARLIAGYRAEAAVAGLGEPIAAGASGKRDYIDRYVRPVLMLDAAERRVGRAASLSFVRQLFALRDALDTAAFRRVADDQLGPEVGGLVARCIDRRDWPTECGGGT